MSRRGLDQAKLRDILAIREVQCDLAESRSRKARLDLQAAEDTERAEMRRLTEIEALWLHSLNAGDFTTVPYWSEALEQKDRDHKGAVARHRDAKQSCEQTASAWHLAMARTELAQRVLGTARKRTVRDADEARQRDVADRFAFTGRRP